jgi:hypothetical protein
MQTVKGQKNETVKSVIRREPGCGTAHLHLPQVVSMAFDWDTTNASIGKHTLKVEIPPVAGEKITEDNVKTVTIEVKEPRR